MSEPVILRIEATKRPIYATDGFEYIRTEPRKRRNGTPTFVGFIKTSLGESEVLASNKTLNDALFQGKEIKQNTYKRKTIKAPNAFGM